MMIYTGNADGAKLGKLAELGMGIMLASSPNWQPRPRCRCPGEKGVTMSKILWRLEGSASRFSEVPAGAVVDTVDGRHVVGACELCGGLLYESTEYHLDSEGIMWHRPGRCRPTVAQARKEA